MDELAKRILQSDMGTKHAQTKYIFTFYAIFFVSIRACNSSTTPMYGIYDELIMF